MLGRSSSTARDNVVEPFLEEKVWKPGSGHFLGLDLNPGQC